MLRAQQGSIGISVIIPVFISQMLVKLLLVDSRKEGSRFSLGFELERRDIVLDLANDLHLRLLSIVPLTPPSFDEDAWFGFIDWFANIDLDQRLCAIQSSALRLDGLD